MEIKLYKTVKEFLNENENWLLEIEALSQLILKNALLNIEAECSNQLLFGVCIDDKKRNSLIFCNCAPFNLCVCYSSKSDYKEATRKLADYIYKNQISIAGINACKTICDLFIETYTNISTLKFKLCLAMDIMVLTKLNQIKLAKGTVRKADFNDIELVVNFEVEFAKEALNETVSIDEKLLKVQNKIENGIVYLFINDKGKPVSVVDAARKLKNGVVFNEVYTPKAERKKGYAQTNMFLVSKMFLEASYKFCSLFVDKTNPISNHVYKNIGYKILEDNYDYRIIN